MMSSNTSDKPSNAMNGIILKPNYRLPLLIIALGVCLFPIPALKQWIAIVVSSFGTFLLIQSFTLRLEFTQTDLVVLQLGKELRRFPFKSWLAWRLILPGLPGLLYFREEASPHLLPILFDPESLKEQLRLKVGKLEKPQESIKPLT